MHRDVVQVDAYALLAQRFEDLAMRLADLVQLQADHVEVQPRIAVRMLPRHGDGQSAKEVVIALSQLMTARDVLVKTLHLADAQCRL
ncbi:hypothetical protein D3C84_901650 [compost metagenome]